MLLCSCRILSTQLGGTIILSFESVRNSLSSILVIMVSGVERLLDTAEFCRLQHAIGVLGSHCVLFVVKK